MMYSYHSIRDLEAPLSETNSVLNTELPPVQYICWKDTRYIFYILFILIFVLFFIFIAVLIYRYF